MGNCDGGEPRSRAGRDVPPGTSGSASRSGYSRPRGARIRGREAVRMRFGRTDLPRKRRPSTGGYRIDSRASNRAWEENSRQRWLRHIPTYWAPHPESKGSERSVRKVCLRRNQGQPGLRRPPSSSARHRPHRIRTGGRRPIIRLEHFPFDGCSSVLLNDRQATVDRWTIPGPFGRQDIETAFAPLTQVWQSLDRNGINDWRNSWKRAAGLTKASYQRGSFAS